MAGLRAGKELLPARRVTGRQRGREGSIMSNVIRSA